MSIIPKMNVTRPLGGQTAPVCVSRFSPNLNLGLNLNYPHAVKTQIVRPHVNMRYRARNCGAHNSLSSHWSRSRFCASSNVVPSSTE